MAPLSSLTSDQSAARVRGNIYKRADGLFVGRIMFGRKPNGRPDRPKVIRSTRAAVLKQIAELRRQADEGTVVNALQARQTVAAYLDVCRDAAGTTSRQQTLLGYRQIVRARTTSAGRSVSHERLRNRTENAGDIQVGRLGNAPAYNSAPSSNASAAPVRMAR
jgi:hypothetical protein